MDKAIGLLMVAGLARSAAGGAQGEVEVNRARERVKVEFKPAFKPEDYFNLEEATSGVGTEPDKVVDAIVQEFPFRAKITRGNNGHCFSAGQEVEIMGRVGPTFWDARNAQGTVSQLLYAADFERIVEQPVAETRYPYQARIVAGNDFHYFAYGEVVTIKEHRAQWGSFAAVNAKGKEQNLQAHHFVRI